MMISICAMSKASCRRKKNAAKRSRRDQGSFCDKSIGLDNSRDNVCERVKKDLKRIEKREGNQEGAKLH